MLLRFDPFRELDRLTEEAVGGRISAMPMDVVRKGDTVEARFDLPGVDPSSIDLEVERNVLNLRAERHWERTEDEEVITHERRHGTYSRQIFLGDNLDTGKVEASYEDGVLTVRIPLAETAKPRKIEVGHGSGRASITAETSDAA